MSNTIVDDLEYWQNSGDSTLFFENTKIKSIINNISKKYFKYSGLDRSHLDDLKKESILKLLEEMPRYEIRYKDDAPIVEYVKKICYGACRIYIKKEKQLYQKNGKIKERLIYSLNNTDENSNEFIEMISNQSFEQPEDFLEKKETYNKLYEAMKHLSPKQQQAIQGFYFENLTLKEIGIKLGIEKSAVSRLIKRGKEKIKKNLEKM